VIGFQRQHVVGIGFADLLGDVLLAVQRVGCDDATGQFQAAQQFRNGSDLVAFVGGLELAKHQTIGAGPGADQMNRPPLLGAVETAAHRFAPTAVRRLWVQFRKAVANSCGSSRRKTRRNVSCEGMPLAGVRKVRSQSSLARPNCSLWTKPVPPQSKQQTAIRRTSSSSCSLVWLRRGSVMVRKACCRLRTEWLFCCFHPDVKANRRAFRKPKFPVLTRLPLLAGGSDVRG